MRLDNLLNDVDVFDRPADSRRIDITNIAERIEDVVPGTLFACVVGATVDRHDLAAEAVSKGATALIVQREVNVTVPQVRVSDVRQALAPVAAAFYDKPAQHLRMAGVTGTNGKTTTVHLLSGIFTEHKWSNAMIGTLSGHYTTPPPIELQRLLAEHRKNGVHAIAMEVSSAGLVQRRVDAVRFGVAVFTNLTQDHLDYHGTMEKYFEAKSMLFDPGRAKEAVVNVDDEYGRRLVERLGMPTISYSLKDVDDLHMTPRGSRFRWRGAQVNLPLLGAFNVSNALAAANAAHCMGVPTDTIAAALSKATPVSGRFESVDAGQKFTVVVDFAHTPDGLVNVLKVARGIAAANDGRVITTFGCGGDRDADKRPKMGAIAADLADRVIVTSDNPRSEDPQSIIEQILAGTEHHSDRTTVDVDRKTAIEHAIGEARRGDVVVIAGKGHETTQEIAGVKHPFDDRQVALQALRSLSGEATTW